MSKNRYEIFPKDWDTIDECITSKSELVKAKRVLAHTILRLYGLRISNLKYFAIAQIDNLFKGKTCKIIPIKSNNVENINIVYIPEIRPILKKAKPYYGYIVKNWSLIEKEIKKKIVKLLIKTRIYLKVRYQKYGTQDI